MVKLPLMIAVLINILCSGPINATEIEKAQAAEELLELTHIEKAVNAIRGQMTGMLAARLRSASVPEAMRDKLSRLQQQIADLIFDELNFTKLRPAYVESYATTFTIDELNGLVEFFKSPVGRAYVDKMPILSKQIMALAQARVVKITPRIKQLTDEFVAELKRETAKP